MALAMVLEIRDLGEDLDGAGVGYRRIRVVAVTRRGVSVYEHVLSVEQFERIFR